MNALHKTTTISVTACARTDAEKLAAYEEIVKAAVTWVYDQSCSDALRHLEDVVVEYIGVEID